MPIDLSTLLHAQIVMLIGLLSGAPMGLAMLREASAQEINGWRVAHSGLSMGGAMRLAGSKA